MSMEDSDSLELLINGEPATMDQFELLEGLSMSLIESSPGAFLRQCGYELTATGAGVRIASWENEDDPDDTNVTVALYRVGNDEASFMITYFYNQKPSVLPPDAEELEEALEVANELLDSGLLVSDAKFIVQSLKEMLDFIDRYPEMGIGPDANPQSSTDAITMAGMMAWELIRERCEGTVTVKVYGFRWDDGDELSVTRNELQNDIPDVPVHDTDIPWLQIIFEESASGFTYVYSLDQEKKRSLEVTGKSLEFAVEIEPVIDTILGGEEEAQNVNLELSEEDQMLAAFRQQLGMDDTALASQDVQVLIRALVSAQMEDPTQKTQ